MSKRKRNKWQTKHYTENQRSSNTNLIKYRGWTQVLLRVS